MFGLHHERKRDREPEDTHTHLCLKVLVVESAVGVEHVRRLWELLPPAELEPQVLDERLPLIFAPCAVIFREGSGLLGNALCESMSE